MAGSLALGQVHDARYVGSCGCWPSHIRAYLLMKCDYHQGPTDQRKWAHCFASDNGRIGSSEDPADVDAYLQLGGPVARPVG